MRYDWLLEPLSEGGPAGPDLDEEGDSDYLNFVLSVANRIPERFYERDRQTGAEKPIDRSKIKLPAEVQAIDRLLERSRDLRLLAIEARLQSFAGDMTGFADCVEAMAGLLGAFWEGVHPKAIDGDLTLRQNVLSGLDDWLQIIQPLQHLGLVRDRRLDVVTFRQFAVATGLQQKRPDETAADIADIHRALASEDNRAASDASYGAAVRAKTGLARIRSAFAEFSGYDYMPAFDRLELFLSQLVGLFEAARPELAAAAAAAAAVVAAPSETNGSEAAAAAPPLPVAAPAAPVPTGRITDHAAAASALLAAERYLRDKEPSSPALLLVHQARTLVGLPLIEAIERLLPDAAAKAVMKIQPDIALQMNMAQMKQLSEDVVDGADGGATREAPAFSAVTRAEAQALLAEVEHFFRIAEPSSPVPMLLGKANGYANRDFAGILKELLGSA